MGVFVVCKYSFLVGSFSALPAKQSAVGIIVVALQHHSRLSIGQSDVSLIITQVGRRNLGREESRQEV